MANVYRQGDVVLKSIDDRFVIDVTQAEKDKDSLIVEGSQGHNHELKAPVYWRGFARIRIVVVSIPTDLTHPQHRTLVIAPGQYEVLGVRDDRRRDGGD